MDVPIRSNWCASLGPPWPITQGAFQQDFVASEDKYVIRFCVLYDEKIVLEFFLTKMFPLEPSQKQEFCGKQSNTGRHRGRHNCCVLTRHHFLHSPLVGWMLFSTMFVQEIVFSEVKGFPIATVTISFSKLHILESFLVSNALNTESHFVHTAGFNPSRIDRI